MIGRFYAICNYCCGAMLAHQNGTPMLVSSGIFMQINEELFISYGSCASYCQLEALSTEEGISAVDEAKCMGCGVCVIKCPVDALSLRPEESKSVPLEIFKLMAKAVGGLICELTLISPF